MEPVVHQTVAHSRMQHRHHRIYVMQEIQLQFQLQEQHIVGFAVERMAVQMPIVLQHGRPQL